ncbi:MAG: phospholipase D-like domain-containing protein [Stackebrandtia sp.]
MRLSTVAGYALAAVVVAAAVAVPATANAEESDPVIDHAVFNNPTGELAEQNAIFIQFGRLIDRVPENETIAMSFFGYDKMTAGDGPESPDLTAKLIAAHERGVNVKLVGDAGQAGNEEYKKLSAALGNDDAKSSWIVHCGDQFPDRPDRGCIGTRAKEWSGGTVYAYNHNKFATFSSVTMNDGTKVPNVVFTGSSNIGTWDANVAFNNMFTFSDKPGYDAFVKYFDDLRAARYTEAGNNDYYTDTGNASPYRMFFFPRHERAGQPFEDPGSDTIYNTLQSVDPSCKYQETDGSWHQTDVRVAMLAFNRPAIAEKLAELKKNGCWVDVVYSDANADVLNALSGIQTTKCQGDLRVHSKYMLIDGAFDDDITPRVYTGSHNYAWSALRQSDEALVRVQGREIHTEYLDNFYTVRDTCETS